MAETGGPQLYVIGHERPFADALVGTLLAQHQAKPEDLARAVIILPNSRAVSAVRDAFIRRAEEGLLMPRMLAVGDLELDIDAGIGLAALSAAAASEERAIISPAERTMRLARMIQQLEEKLDNVVDAPAAMQLAQGLGNALDQLIVFGTKPQDLATLDVGGLGAYWQKSLIMLQLLWREWPDVLAALGKDDAVAVRNRILDRLAQAWTASPPDHPVLAAGISTNAPAVVRLLRVIARMPKGAVVFAGLDLAMPAQHREQIMGRADPERPGRRIGGDERHPQHALLMLLDAMNARPDDVRTWPGQDDAQPGIAVRSRSALISALFVPAAFSGAWRNARLVPEAVAGLCMIELASPDQEAQAIALLMRETLETPGKRAALVTPDRMLAERVIAHLARWGIAADDSAGQSLLLLPPGAALMALVQAVASQWAPVPLIALLQNPLVQAGEGRLPWLDRVRELDLALRGPRPAAGLDGIANFLEEMYQGLASQADDGPEWAARLDAQRRLQGWWNGVSAMVAPLDHALAEAGRTRAMGPLVAALRKTLSGLCGDGIWQGQAGRQLAQQIERWESQAPHGPLLADTALLPDLVGQLLRGLIVRKAYGDHPRLSILGTLEARLQSADRLILGGLNEGSWPRPMRSDPWLATGVRAALGLPGIDTQIGLAAQDFASALAAPEVLLTRAKRDETSPTIASRFWLRLKALAGDAVADTCSDLDLARLAREMDAADPVPPMARPAPRPPQTARPKAISATRLDMLRADPFSFYARHVLKLERLRPLDAPPDAAWRGTIIHRLLENWVNGGALDVEALLDAAGVMLRGAEVDSIMRTLWQPRLLSGLRWAGAQIIAAKAEGRVPWLVEEKGRIQYAGISLSGTADRIDQLAGGEIAIVDYKSGSSQPSVRQRQHGYALQLGLLALIAREGGFRGQPLAPVALEYWVLGARDKKTDGIGQVQHPHSGKDDSLQSLSPDNFADFAARHLADAAQAFLRGDAAFVAKAQPRFARYTDYEQLMRYLEWFGRSSMDDGEAA